MALNQRAFHGGPTRGIERMSTDFIGTGEGYQVFGWGIYSAEARETGEEYRRTLSKSGGKPGYHEITIGGEKYTGKRGGDGRIKWEGANIDNGGLNLLLSHLATGETIDNIKRKIAYRIDRNREDSKFVEDSEEALRIIENSDIEVNKGQLYRLEVPESDVLLDWDKKLKDQPEKVRSALDSISGIDMVDAWKSNGAWDHVHGDSLYHTLSSKLGSQKAASKYLNSLGIPGLQYLDQLSRTDGEGTHNFVVWDEDAMEIMETYYQGIMDRDDKKPSREESRMKNTPGNPWPDDFPQVTTLADYKSLKGHPDYEAAKSGDNEAAVRLVRDLLDNIDALTELGNKHPNAILLGIHAEESNGRNKIPQVLAELIGGVTGLEVDENILQSNIVNHTGAGQNTRLFNRPEFDGEVQKGRDYILIDDMVTMGGTFGELRHYIEANGGRVVDMISLSTQHENNKRVALTDKTKLDLERTFGLELNGGKKDMTLLSDFLRESGMYGGNYEALAESEARAFIHIKTLDEARNRRTSARQTGNIGIRKEEIRRNGSNKSDLNQDTESRPDEGGSLYQGAKDEDISSLEFKTPTAEEFVAARDKSKRAMFLTPYSAEKLTEKGAKLYLTDDGVGFALMPDGDMIGVFNNSNRPGAGQEAVIQGIADGAKTLDCIGSYLENYYKRFGFVEKGRATWDDEQAPAGWDYETGGRPPVIFFEYPDELSRDPFDVARRYELARSGQTAGGVVQSGGDSGINTGVSGRVRNKEVLGEPQTPPGSTGTASNLLNTDTESRPDEGGFFQGPVSGGFQEPRLIDTVRAKPINIDDLPEGMLDALPAGIESPDGRPLAEAAAELNMTPDALLQALIDEAAQAEMEIELLEEMAAHEDIENRSRKGVFVSIRDEGGLSYALIKSSMGEEEARELKKRLGPGLFRKNGLGLDRMAAILGFEGDSTLYRFLLESKDSENAVQAAKSIGFEEELASARAEINEYKQAVQQYQEKSDASEKANETEKAKAKEKLVSLENKLRKRFNRKMTAMSEKQWRRMFIADERAQDRIEKERGKTDDMKIQRNIEKAKGKIALEDARAAFVERIANQKAIGNKRVELIKEKIKVSRAIKYMRNSARDKYHKIADEELKQIQALVNNADFKKMSIKDILDMAGKVKELRDQGGEKMQAWREENKKRREGIVKGLIESLYRTPDKTPSVKADIEDMAKKGKSGVIYDITKHAKSLRPARFFDWLDGGKARFDGAFTKFFVDGKNRAQNEELHHTKRRSDKMTSALRELGLKAWQLGKTRGIAFGREYTVDEILEMMAALRNEKDSKALIFGAFGDAIREGATLLEVQGEISRLISLLSEDEKKIANLVIQDHEANVDRIDNALIKARGRGMGPREKNYIGMHRIGLNVMEGKTITDDVAAALVKGDSHSFFSSIENMLGFTNARIDIKDQNQTPISLGLMKNWEKDVATQEHAAAYLGYLIDAASVLWQKNPDNPRETIAGMVAKRFGWDAYKTLISNFNVMVSPDGVIAKEIFDKAASILAQSAAISYLSWNYGTTVLQLTGIIRGLPFCGSKLAVVTARALMNPKAFLENVYEQAPQIQARGGDITIAALFDKNRLSKKDSKAARVSDRYNDFIAMGFEGLAIVDRFAAAIVWQAAYEKSGGDADYSLRAVQLTQQATSVMDTSMAWRASKTMRALNMLFLSETAAVFEMTTYDVVQALRQKDWNGTKQAFYTILALSLSAALANAFRNGVPDEDETEEEINMVLEMGVKPIAKDLIQSMPLLGNVLTSVWDRVVEGKYYPDRNILEEPLYRSERLAKFVRDWYRDGEWEDGAGRAADDLITMLSLTGRLKIPWTGVKKLYRAGDYLFGDDEE